MKNDGHYIPIGIGMPNHTHAVICFHNTGKTINSIAGNDKRFMAYDIVERLQKQNHHDTLLQIKGMVNNTQKAINKQHEVFESSFNWKDCGTEKIIEQKLNYMHWNPCKGVNKLVDSPEQYIHSSAKFYIIGEQGIYSVTSYTELQDIELTK
ncbi:MAG TPA: hypothetical protein VN958_06290 [Chitinophagaceae bacterium]|nr:hypothetical protein [Chitinophagaceae bacterium]